MLSHLSPLGTRTQFVEHATILASTSMNTSTLACITVNILFVSFRIRVYTKNASVCSVELYAAITPMQDYCWLSQCSVQYVLILVRRILVFARLRGAVMRSLGDQLSAPRNGNACSEHVIFAQDCKPRSPLNQYLFAPSASQFADTPYSVRAQTNLARRRSPTHFTCIQNYHVLKWRAFLHLGLIDTNFVYE